MSRRGVLRLGWPGFVGHWGRIVEKCPQLQVAVSASWENLDVAYQRKPSESYQMRIRRKYLLQNTAFGLFLGVELALLLAWAFNAEVREDVARFYTYLITASVSLLAATLTLIGVFANIENVREAETERRKRKLISARAFLPTSLSKVCEICEAGISYSHNFERDKKNLGEIVFRERSLSDLALPNGVVDVFRDIIELTDDDKVRERLAGIFQEHQVHLARWRSEFESSPNVVERTDSELKQRTVGWAYIYAIASSLFDFARGETEAVEEFEPARLIMGPLRTTKDPTILAGDFDTEIGLYERAFRRRFY